MQKRKTPVHLPVLEQNNKSVIIFLTVCSHSRKPILADDKVMNDLIDIWSKLDYWRVGRYVFMPDHIHLFCAPARIPPHSLKLWVRLWKREASKRLGNLFDAPIWQKNYWDTQLRKGDSYSEKWCYVQNNPVRKGLVSDSSEWRYQGELNTLMWHD